MCNCGEYFVKDQLSTKVCVTIINALNFTMEISVKISAINGEKTVPFHFFSSDMVLLSLI